MVRRITNLANLRPVSGTHDELSGVPVSAQFATTHWSVVLAAGERKLPQAAEALEKLCRAYWYPLCFLR